MVVTEKFKNYLYGAEFTVFTDNNPLVHLQTTRLGTVKQQWAAQLANFRYQIPARCPEQEWLPDTQEGAPVCVDQIAVKGGETWAEPQMKDPGLRQLRQWKEQQLPSVKWCDPLGSYAK